MIRMAWFQTTALAESQGEGLRFDDMPTGGVDGE
jgi:hypothetical protein